MVPAAAGAPPTVTELRAAGLWDLMALDPRVASLVERVAQRRMVAFPLPSDASTLVATAPLIDTAVARTQAIMYPIGGLHDILLRSPTSVIFADHLSGNRLAPFVRWLHGLADAGEMAPTPSVLLHAIEHELHHPVASALLTLPGTLPWLERTMAQVLGSPFRFANGSSRAKVRRRFGAYAMAVADDAGRGTPPDIPMVAEEFMADAFALSSIYGINAPEGAKAVTALGAALLCGDGPALTAIQGHLHHVHRIVRTKLSVELERCYRAGTLSPEAIGRLEADPDWQWQLDHPDPARDDVPAMVDDLRRRASSGELREQVAVGLDRATAMVREQELQQRFDQRPSDPVVPGRRRRWGSADPSQWSQREREWIELAAAGAALTSALRLEGELRGIPPKVTEQLLQQAGHGAASFAAGGGDAARRSARFPSALSTRPAARIDGTGTVSQPDAGEVAGDGTPTNHPDGARGRSPGQGDGVQRPVVGRPPSPRPRRGGRPGGGLHP